jgi:drug/metabolite transporter (DMT)-like permease
VPLAPSRAILWAHLLGISAAWSSSFLFTRLAIDEIGPITLAGLRGIVSALLLAIWFFATGRRVHVERTQLAVLALLGERLAPLTLLGAVIVIAGVWIVTRARRREA